MRIKDLEITLFSSLVCVLGEGGGGGCYLSFAASQSFRGDKRTVFTSLKRKILRNGKVLPPGGKNGKLQLHDQIQYTHSLFIHTHIPNDRKAGEEYNTPVTLKERPLRF